MSLSMKHNRITVSPDVLTGKLIITKTRLPVEQLIVAETASAAGIATNEDVR